MAKQNPTEPLWNPGTRRRTSSPAFWIIVGVGVVLLIVFVSSGGVPGLFVWLFAAGAVVIGTGLYAWILRRKSWLQASKLKHGKIFVLFGAGAAMLGLIGVAVTAPLLRSAQLADIRPESSSSPQATDTSQTQSTDKSIINQTCSEESDVTADQGKELICTRDGGETLVWMDKESSQRITAKRGEASADASRAAANEKAVEASADASRKAVEAAAAAEAERKASESSAAEARRLADEAAAASEAQRLAAEAAEAERLAAEAAEAERLAAEAAEAQRLAEEELSRQIPIPPAPPAPEGDVYYENCAAAKADGRGPISLDEPGYGEHLDGNSDGVACESN